MRSFNLVDWLIDQRFIWGKGVHDPSIYYTPTYSVTAGTDQVEVTITPQPPVVDDGIGQVSSEDVATYVIHEEVDFNNAAGVDQVGGNIGSQSHLDGDGGGEAVSVHTIEAQVADQRAGSVRPSEEFKAHLSGLLQNRGDFSRLTNSRGSIFLILVDNILKVIRKNLFFCRHVSGFRSWNAAKHLASYWHPSGLERVLLVQQLLWRYNSVTHVLNSLKGVGISFIYLLWGFLQERALRALLGPLTRRSPSWEERGLRPLRPLEAKTDASLLPRPYSHPPPSWVVQMAPIWVLLVRSWTARRHSTLAPSGVLFPRVLTRNLSLHQDVDNIYG